MNRELHLKFSTTPEGRFRVSLQDGSTVHTVESPAPYPNEPLSDRVFRNYLIPCFMHSLEGLLEKLVFPEHTRVYGRIPGSPVIHTLGFPGEFLAKCDGNHGLQRPVCIDPDCWLAHGNPLRGATPL